MLNVTIKQMDADAEGWVEVVVTMQTDGEEPEGETVGHIRPVEGTTDGPVTWWDARAIDEARVHTRRFASESEALLALAARPYLVKDAQTLLGW